MGTNAKRRYTCPHCQKGLLGPQPTSVARVFKCPSCQGRVTVGAFKTEETVEPPEPDIPPPPPQQPLIRPTQRQAPPTRRRSLPLPNFSRHPRATGQLVWWLIWLGPPAFSLILFALFIATGAATKDPATDQLPAPVVALGVIASCMCCPYLFFGFLIANVTAIPLTSLLLKSVRCPACSSAVSLISTWQCSCGYHDHRLRHALRFKCPSCGKGCDQMNCPRCEATILL